MVNKAVLGDDVKNWKWMRVVTASVGDTENQGMACFGNFYI